MLLCYPFSAARRRFRFLPTCFIVLHNENMVSKLDKIALKAAVSKATVSRVLNERPGVSPSMRQAVLDALDELGFERPQTMRSVSNGVVGLVVPTLEEPAYLVLSQVIQTELSKRGYVAMTSVQDPVFSGELDIVRVISEHDFAGVIVLKGFQSWESRGEEIASFLSERKIPAVFVNAASHGKVPAFSSDDGVAAEIAVRHLISLGHTSIGLMLPSIPSTSSKRFLAGYRAATTKDLGDFRTEFVEVSHAGEQLGYAAALRLRQKGATALVCASDRLALGAIHSLAQHGYQVLREVSVTGYGDSNFLMHTAPALTTVRQPMLAIGSAVARTLADKIEGKADPTGESVFAPELVIRSTTAHL